MHLCTEYARTQAITAHERIVEAFGSQEGILDAEFLTGSRKTALGFAELPYEAPLCARLMNRSTVAAYLAQFFGNQLFGLEDEHKVCHMTEAGEQSVPEEVAAEVLAVYHWVMSSPGALRELLLDLKAYPVGPHYPVNLLLGNRAGYPYLNALKFLNKLYQMGLVDPDSMTQTYDQMMPKMQKGNCLFSIFDYAGSNLYNTPEHMTDTGDKAGSIMRPLVPTEAKPIVYGLSTGGNTRIWSIGNNSMYPEKCMQLINWLYAPEGGMTIWYGIKGLMWDYDENGNIYFTELGQMCANDPSYDLTGVEWTSPETGNT